MITQKQIEQLGGYLIKIVAIREKLDNQIIKLEKTELLLKEFKEVLKRK